MKNRLGIIIPFYYKINEFKFTFPINWWKIPNKTEIILSVDEPHSGDLLIDFIKKYNNLRWKIICNNRTHIWRSPCAAINVGIKHSISDYLLVVSPESIFVNNLISKVYENVSKSQACAGRLYKCKLGEVKTLGINECVKKYPFKEYYGSICFPRKSALNVCGYDECMVDWGGDDDNFRVRLKMDGISLKYIESGILHVLDENRTDYVKGTYTKFTKEEIYFPKHKICPHCSDKWGQDYKEIIYCNYL
ncbi:MAG TPA: galactosyltransferase-related protein [Bacteroidales bacterium]|nr:galactosyltransferase-related protein [Bacteroidales bacterium]